MTDFGIAGLQLELSHTNNLETIKREVYLTKKIFPWVKMIVLSELSSYGSNISFAQSTKGEAYKFYSELAKDNEIFLVTGSFFAKNSNRISNMSLVFDPIGAEIARYSKMFPFEPYETGITPGNEFCVFDTVSYTHLTLPTSSWV